jgi:Uma2 family endonuclease
VDEVQPDVIVARFDDLTRANLPVAPVMVAEVASRSTRLHDRNTKKAHYERLGVPSYWLLDPGRAPPTLTRSRGAGGTRCSPQGLSIMPGVPLDVGPEGESEPPSS